MKLATTTNQEPRALSTHEADDGVTVVIAVNPLETVLIEIVLPQCRFIFVERIQLLHHPLKANVRLVIQQIPLQVSPNIPFSTLAELHAHEDRFLAGMGPHVGKQGTRVGVLLPVISWHLVKQMTLAVYDFVVTEGKHKVFGVRIPDRKRDVVLVKLSEPWVQLKVIEHVVHPTHVPFQVEPKSAVFCGLSHHRPSGGFFCDRESSWKVLEKNVIGLLEKANCFGIFSTAILIS